MKLFAQYMRSEVNCIRSEGVGAEVAAKDRVAWRRLTDGPILCEEKGKMMICTGFVPFFRNKFPGL